MSGLPVRFGAVGALATPPAVVHDHRASGHFSLVADEAETYEEARAEGGSTSTRGPQCLMPSIRLSPPSMDHVRSSYMTSTTEGSRMSGLSDFPSPPDSSSPPLQPFTLVHPAAKSRFADDTPQNSILDPPYSNQAMTTENRRMTFGGSANVESVTPVVRDAPEPE